MGVHALVRETKGVGGVLCFQRQQDAAVRGGDRETLAVLGQRFAGRLQHGVPAVRSNGSKQTELVASDPVAAGASLQGRPEPVGEAHEQQIAGRVPVGVVI